MNDLVVRKRLLIAQADLHRQLIGMECAQIRGSWEAVRSFAGRHRWWLLGGAFAGGWLLTRRARGAARWLPTLIATWRALKR